MLHLYSFVTWFLQLFVRRKLIRRAQVEPVYGECIEERFGQYANSGKLSLNGYENRPLIWIHAVSLGETRAAAILLKELRLAIPTMRLLLTNGTATGRAEGVKLLLDGDIQVWQPWDTQAATARFFKHFKPQLGILMETELWPNLIQSANQANVPMLLANARLSEKSFNKSQHWFSKDLASLSYRGLAAVYAQTNDDANRLKSLGAKVDGVFGNLKFDITPSAEQMSKAEAFKALQLKPIVVFASSRQGEETEFLEQLQNLPPQDVERAQWLIVPRHPQRFDEVATLITDSGFQVSRRSANPDFEKLNLNGQKITIWLGDSIGEMAFYYGMSSVALLGGSFERFGGQNLIEALACGCPVVMGPHTFNFEEAASLAVNTGVAFRVDSLASAISCALQAMPQLELRERAMAFVQTHQGASAKTAAAVQQFA